MTPNRLPIFILDEGVAVPDSCQSTVKSAHRPAVMPAGGSHDGS